MYMGFILLLQSSYKRCYLKLINTRATLITFNIIRLIIHSPYQKPGDITLVTLIKF
jgi:hypothetical protein